MGKLYAVTLMSVCWTVTGGVESSGQALSCFPWNVCDHEIQTRAAAHLAASDL